MKVRLCTLLYKTPSIYDIVNILKRFFGTVVPKPLYAAELRVEKSLLRAWGVNGMCIRAEIVSTLLIDAQNKKTSLNQREQKDLQKICKASNKNKCIVLIPRWPWRIATFLINFVLFFSLRNHERTHAHTMFKTASFHNKIFDFFINECTEFYEIGEEICLESYWENLLKLHSNERDLVEWAVTTEVLARIAAILHAPTWARELVARAQITKEYKRLLTLSLRIEADYGNVENFMKAIDIRINSGLERTRHRDDLLPCLLLGITSTKNL